MFRAPAALVVFGARAGRLALPVSLCLFGASTADCTKRKVTKPKGACWDAYTVAMVAEFQAMKDYPDADPGGVMTPQHWDIAEQIVRVRIEGGAAHGEGRKVGLILPHHTVAHLLNPFTKELPKDENGLNNPAARMPNDASRSLNFIFTKLFKGDAAKVRKADAQFLNYWSELGPFKAMCDKFRANLKDAVAADTTTAGALAAMGPLQKTMHLLKLQKAQLIGPYVSTWIAGEAPELAHVMEAMASITVGCVRVERSIKVQKMIHSKVRNRLLHHKVEMLVTSLEDMLEPESEEQMEAILGDMVDEAIRTVESKDAEDVVVIE
ncbi:hypothetical protein M885DRAFT_623670 [Pelagophyceae sp. CCMP2097]|nr:hypothetical protein M885DRAFT_623670 [Pelagophyceae sp. CCMP2097]